MTTKSDYSRKPKRRNYVRDLPDGARLLAEVSPCVFMYPGYPLQIQVTLLREPGERLGNAFVHDRSKTASTYKTRDVERLLRDVRTAPCPRCSTPAFDPTSVQTNRGGLCEDCFVGDLEAEHAKQCRAEQRSIAARDHRMKQNGMAVRVSAWIHPESGDDYQVDWYRPKRPTPGDVRKLLIQHGSVVLNDFQIITL